MQKALWAHDRAVLRIAGPDREGFLQDLVTNDISRLKDGAVYAALLSPQGKYLFDFFLLPDDEAILIDVQAERAAALAQRLAMYRLRAKVEIEPSDLQVVQVFGAWPDGAMVFADPRDPGLGWRVYSEAPEAVLEGLEAATEADWTALRVAHRVPETGVELQPEEAYILEQGFERLNGVDFRKGCYVGQEVTARMKHKTELRKRLVKVRILAGSALPNTAILCKDKPVGELFSAAGDCALAYLRLDRIDGPLQAGDAVLELA